MAKEIKLSTTGSLDPVVINDMAGKSFSHPTVDYNLLENLEFTLEEIRDSQDLESLLSLGHVTLTNELSANILNLQSLYKPDEEEMILFLAGEAPGTASYDGNEISAIVYNDFEGITNHTKSFTFTGKNLTNTQEIFDYNSQNWTVDVTLGYSGKLWQSKSVTITIN
jgi:hypothetical protein